MKGKLWAGPWGGPAIVKDILEDETMKDYKPGDLEDVTIRRWGTIDTQPPRWVDIALDTAVFVLAFPVGFVIGWILTWLVW